ncbi:putative baseplate assembly protein [Chitinimonas sp.]|uniref:putative baseplate assembly protein n=1 Tax=Chitinimonas sp. TaxID=1934313 RepID=UPI002F940B88
MACKSCGCTTANCGCCEGVQLMTPVDITNRPGLDAIAYRVGTHGRFLASMQARLSSLRLKEADDDSATAAAITPLAQLTTRDPADPAMALLDGWACVADVLSFYQERLANEAYLRTATERRSVLELARLVGYALRPGVAASVYLAYTLDDNQIAPVMIAAGTRSQSVPGPDELPQSFETSEALLARAEWNDLQVRKTQPQRLTADSVRKLTTLYLSGTATQLKPNDPLLFLLPGEKEPLLRYVASVQVDFEQQRTALGLVSLNLLDLLRDQQESATQPEVQSKPGALGILRNLSTPLSIPPALPAARSSAALQRNLSDSLSEGSDVQAQLLGVLNPAIQQNLYRAWSAGAKTAESGVQVYGFGVRAAPFGSTSPLKPIPDREGGIARYDDWPLEPDVSIGIALAREANTDGSFAWFVALKLSWNGVLEQIDPVEFKPKVIGKNAVTLTLFGEPEQGGRLRFAFVDGSSREVTVRIQPVAGVATATVSCAGLTLKVAAGSRETVGTDPTELLSAQFTDANHLNIASVLAASHRLALDSSYEQIVPGGISLVMRGGRLATQALVLSTATNARSGFGITGKSTELRLSRAWRDGAHEFLLADVRSTTVFAQSQLLTLAEVPLTEVVKGQRIDLARLYDGLKTGRWIIVSGERADIVVDGKPVPGVMAAELVMIAGVEQSFDASLPGDAVHTTLLLANALAYAYQRETLRIYGNVVKATHGETRNETLGSGNGAVPLQAFALKQPPLTFVSSPTPSGVDSSLKVYVNDTQWHEADTLADKGPRERAFTTKTDDAGVTSLIFGNGEQGARLPTGVENVKAVYRNGIGRAGNVKAGEITLLQTRPLGVKEVNNPVRASGGADREGLALARESAPLAVLALDRLVSTQDYADFARTFAGIGKSAASRLYDRGRALVLVTIAGVDDIPIDPNSDLYLNLQIALRRFGDPSLPVRLAIRELLVLVLSANVRLKPDYLWEPVAAKIRAALLARFGFARQALGQSVSLGQVISLIQGVEGVAYVDVDTFTSTPENTTRSEGQANAANVPSGLPKPYVPVYGAQQRGGQSLPAQLALFTPDVPDTLILNQIG